MVTALKPGDRLKELGEGHHFAAHIAEVITVSVRMGGIFHGAGALAAALPAGVCHAALLNAGGGLGVCKLIVIA